MLDVSLQAVRFTRGTFTLEVSITFPANSHTALIGGSGKSTLLQLVAGRLRPQSGEIRIGSRIVTSLKESKRPLLYVTSTLDVPSRWSVRHALIAAVRRRTLDRVDRQHEYELAVEKWRLDPDRTIRELSTSEQTRVHLARIELLKPGILVADRLLERLSASQNVADEFYRTLRVAGTTVISVPSTLVELGTTDRVVILANGRIVQQGAAAHVHAHPSSEESAAATGAVNVIPLTINGAKADSVIGSWDVAAPPFQGSGVALIRPEAFSLAPRGSESDLIVAVEEASFDSGRWLVRAFLTGGIPLSVSLPGEARLHKGKLLALIYDPTTFALVKRDVEAPRHSAPTDVVPPMSSTR